MFTYKESYKTRVYVSDTGYVCVGQINPFFEDQLVCLTPDQAEWLVTKINNAIAEAAELFEKDEDEDATEA